MKTKLLKSVLGAMLLSLAASSASAVVLSLTPASQQAMPGDTVSVDLTISGLGDEAAPALGVFDIDLQFDDSALSFVDYELGGFLGDANAFESIDFSAGDLGGGVISLGELSLLPVPDLIALQPDTFSLGTLIFDVDVLAEGSFTTVSIFDIAALGDQFGRALQVDGTLDAVIRNGMAVAEPGVLALFALGLAFLLGQRREYLT